jgi:hypothetical protein
MTAASPSSCSHRHWRTQRSDEDRLVAGDRLTRRLCDFLALLIAADLDIGTECLVARRLPIRRRASTPDGT